MAGANGANCQNCVPGFERSPKFAKVNRKPTAWLRSCRRTELLVVERPTDDDLASTHDAVELDDCVGKPVRLRSKATLLSFLTPQVDEDRVSRGNREHYSTYPFTVLTAGK